MSIFDPSAGLGGLSPFAFGGLALLDQLQPGMQGTSQNSDTFVSPFQRRYLEELFEGGAGIMSRTGNLGMSGIEQTSRGLSTDLMRSGSQFLGSLTSNPFLSGLQQQAGGNPALIDAQAAQLSNLLTQQAGRLSNTINQTGIGVGQLGQSRGDITQGLLAEETQRAFGQGVTDLQTADASRALQAGVAGGGLLAQGALGGLSSLSGLFDLGVAPFSAAFTPALLQRQILGPAIMRSKTRSSGGGGGGGLLGGIF